MPKPAANLGATPSEVCRDLRHRDCPGWGKHGIFRRTVADCTCSCHLPPPTPPRGPSGSSDAQGWSIPPRTSLDDWFASTQRPRVQLDDSGFRGHRAELAWLDEAVTLDEVLPAELGGRGYGKTEQARRFREQLLGEWAINDQPNYLAEVVSKATLRTVRAEDKAIAAAAERAFLAGMGLAVIRHEPELEIGDGMDYRMVWQTSTKATKQIPAGTIFHFPTLRAFELWQDRQHG